MKIVEHFFTHLLFIEFWYAANVNKLAIPQIMETHKNLESSEFGACVVSTTA